MVIYFGATSEVAWLFLLGDWIAALVVAAYFYALWNWRGLSSELEVGSSTPSPSSPVEQLPEQLLRGGPIRGPIFERDHATVELEIHTNGGARGPARVSGFIGAVDVAGATGLVPRVGWKAERLVGPVTRGPVQSRNWVLEAGDPLGLWRFRRRGGDQEIALVLPVFTSLVAQPVVRELEASVAAPWSGSGIELFGVREYRPGDPLRRIHWRSSARRGELVVREYEPPGVQTLGIFCDPEPSGVEVADQIARLAASEAWDCIRNGGRVVLWAPGQEPSTPSDARSLWALLEWLARYPITSPSATSEPPLGVSEAVAVTAGATSQIVDALETVRRRGGRIRAWVVGDADVDLDAPIQRAGTSWPL